MPWRCLLSPHLLLIAPLGEQGELHYPGVFDSFSGSNLAIFVVLVMLLLSYHRRRQRGIPESERSLLVDLPRLRRSVSDELGEFFGEVGFVILSGSDMLVLGLEQDGFRRRSTFVDLRITPALACG